MKVFIPFFISVFLLSCSSVGHKKESNLGVSILPTEGIVERINAFQTDYVSPRNIDVWLPLNYSDAKEYAVLYMHDGQMLYDSSSTWNKQEWMVDEVLQSLINQKKVKDCIVVGIWNGDQHRHADYFPQSVFESLDSSIQDEMYQVERYGRPLLAIEINSDNYLKFIVQEVKPLIDARYSTKKDAANTFIAGSSMGGLISMYGLCQYPDVFGGAACLSTHWPGVTEIEEDIMAEAFVKYLANNLPDPKNHKIYFDYGTETLDALYEPFQLLIDSVMQTKGYSSENWITRKFEGADHSEKAWQKRLDIPLTFILTND